MKTFTHPDSPNYKEEKKVDRSHWMDSTIELPLAPPGTWVSFTNCHGTHGTGEYIYTYYDDRRHN